LVKLDNGKYEQDNIKAELFFSRFIMNEKATNMRRKYTTLKDIAEVCNVTSTLVSAVLNNRNGNISCSDAKRALIRKTAEKMCYKANFFARSMKIDHISIVGLALHLETHDNIGELTMYVNSCLAYITSALNNYKIEVIFIPYSTEQEQLERLSNLLQCNMIGGIITNIIPDSHMKICGFLKHVNLPYMIMGNPLDDEVYCTYPLTEVVNLKIMHMAKARNKRNCFHIAQDGSCLLIRKMPFVDGDMWHTPGIKLADFKENIEESFFAISGYYTWKKLEEHKFSVQHMVLLESEKYRDLIPENMNSIISKDNFDTLGMVRYVSETVYLWLEKSIKPLEKRKIFRDKPDDFKQITSSKD